MASTSGLLNTASLVSVGGGQALRFDAAASWLAVVAEVRAEFGVTLRLTDSYRPYAVQVKIFNERYDPAWTGRGPFGDVRWWGGIRYVRMRGASAAVPGTSNHGWGVAVDITALSGFNGITYTYVAAVAPAHGWNNNAGRKIAEPWHWEYVAADNTHPTHAAPAPAPVIPAFPTVTLEMISMDQAITHAFEFYTGFPPSEDQLHFFTAFWMLNGAEVTAENIRDSAVGQVAQAFRDELKRNPESPAVVSAYLAQFNGDIAAIRAALAASVEGQAHK